MAQRRTIWRVTWRHCLLALPSTGGAVITQLEPAVFDATDGEAAAACLNPDVDDERTVGTVMAAGQAPAGTVPGHISWVIDIQPMPVITRPIGSSIVKSLDCDQGK